MTLLQSVRRSILPALTALLIVPAAFAADSDGPAKPEPKPLTADDLRALGDAIRGDIKSLDGKINAQNAALTRMQQDLADLTARIEKLEGARRRDEDLAGLQRQLADLQGKIDALNRAMTTERVAGANVGVAVPGSTPAAQTAGKLRVTNRYLTPMIVQVNGQSYSLPADATARDIPVPVGTFTYQVVGVHAVPLTRTMTAGGILPVDIFPQGQ